jgi:lambda repressor-like predicted transcriptional regulator
LGALTYQEKLDREVDIKKLLDKGMSLSQMSRELGISQQSVHKFLNVRGWGTVEMKKRKAIAARELEPERIARKAARKKMKTEVDRG